MKRYRKLLGVVTGPFKDMAEQPDGEWVRYEDVKTLARFALEYESVECNCVDESAFARLRRNNYWTHGKPSPYWICPAHGYKKL